MGICLAFWNTGKSTRTLYRTNNAALVGDAGAGSAAPLYAARHSSFRFLMREASTVIVRGYVPSALGVVTIQASEVVIRRVYLPSLTYHQYTALSSVRSISPDFSIAFNWTYQLAGLVSSILVGSTITSVGESAIKDSKDAS